MRAVEAVTMPARMPPIAERARHETGGGGKGGK